MQEKYATNAADASDATAKNARTEAASIRALRSLRTLRSVRWMELGSTREVHQGCQQVMHTQGCHNILTKIRNFRDLRTCQKGPKSDQNVT